MRAALLSVLLLIACGSPGGTDGGSGGGGGHLGGGGGHLGGGGGSTGGGTGGGSTGGGTGGGGGGGSTGDGGLVTVMMLQQNTFVGCLGEGCHSCGFIMTDAGCAWTNNPMSLYGSPQQFAATVVNVMSVSSPGKVRVKPFDPDNSFMVQKLEGHPDAGEGEQMPPGRVLTADQIRYLRDWISQGAQAN